MNTVWMSPHLFRSVCLFFCVSFSPVLHEACITVYLFQSISSDFPKSHKKLWYVLLPSFPSSKIHYFTHLRAPSFHYLLSSGDNYDWNSLGTNHNLCSKPWKCISWEDHCVSTNSVVFPGARHITDAPLLYIYWVAKDLQMNKNLRLFL